MSWESSHFPIVSQLASGGRAMELSDLAVFDGKLVTVDDRTGILYHLKKDQVGLIVNEEMNGSIRNY